MKFLVVNMPCMGCNIPTVGFVKQLVQRGHEVAVTSSSIGDSRIKAMFDIPGVKFIDVNSDSLDGYFDGRECGINDDGMNIAAITMNAINEAPKYDAVIYDYYTFPLYYLKDRNICTIRFFPNFAFNQKLSDRLFRGEESKLIQNAHLIKISDDIFHEVGKRGIDFKYSCIDEEIMNNVADYNIVHTLRELQPYTEDFDDSYQFVGSNGSVTLNSVCTIPFDKMKGKILYISFGTIVSQIGDCRREIIKSIIREYANTEYSLIISVGLLINLNEFENVPKNIYLYNFVPQGEVLKHASVFVTHGGANSINESVYYGVPMIVIPGSFDQIINAEMVEKRQLGYMLDEQDFTSSKLREMIDSVLDDVMINNNVKSMQKEMLDMNCDEMTADLIEKYTREYMER